MSVVSTHSSFQTTVMAVFSKLIFYNVLAIIDVFHLPISTVRFYRIDYRWKVYLTYMITINLLLEVLWCQFHLSKAHW